MNILITGAAGFIGFHTSNLLMKSGHKITGIDSLNNYYSVNLKKKRISILQKNWPKQFKFIKNNLNNEKYILNILKTKNISIIIHLAAQAGVRHSLKKPMDYVKNNIVATTNLMEAARKYSKIKHFLLASTSSVYASSIKMPYNENDPADFPLQFYAATKRSTELMAHSYSHLYGLPFTILRFFTVYGPYGRPDMALFKFTKNILNKKKIDVYNYGKHVRDFTYVSDIAISIKKLLNKIPYNNEKFTLDEKLSRNSKAKIRILNIGNGDPKKLEEYISKIEKYTRNKAKINFLPFQIGDALKTYANISKLKRLIKFSPRVKIDEGIKIFIKWYINFIKIK
jgi:UDP-glucuronate 4-epimerase